MYKVRYLVQVNDGCQWGKDEGWPTLKEAKKEMNQLIKDDKRILKEDGCDGPLGITYRIVKETETDKVVYTEDILEKEV